MGYWGDRAKDGDQPLDLFGLWKDSKMPVNAYLRERIAKVEALREKYPTWSESTFAFEYFALLGCATLMITDKRARVSKRLLRDIFQKSLGTDGGVCKEDEDFVKNYLAA